MSHPHAQSAPSEPTILMKEGWHCLHLYYRVNQAVLNEIPEHKRASGREALLQILDQNLPGAPARIQTSVTSGHKADLGLMIMDPNPLVIDGIRQSIRASDLGTALEPVYSFVSISEVSEYVPTLAQYGDRLKAEGTPADSPAFAVKLKAYEDREVHMKKQRLYPDFPAWPVVCFYPMNKIRHPLANWYDQPYSRRMEMMTEHGKSGMKFGGKVSQLITASTGLDDWEWGVTLWAKEPAFIKEIVYTMRFDEASAKYAEFGPFYVGYIMSPADALNHVKV